MFKRTIIVLGVLCLLPFQVFSNAIQVNYLFIKNELSNIAQKSGLEESEFSIELKEGLNGETYALIKCTNPNKCNTPELVIPVAADDVSTSASVRYAPSFEYKVRSSLEQLIRNSGGDDGPALYPEDYK